MLEQIGPHGSTDGKLQCFSIQRQSIQLCSSSLVSTVWTRATYECDGHLSTSLCPYSISCASLCASRWNLALMVIIRHMSNLTIRNLIILAEACESEIASSVPQIQIVHYWTSPHAVFGFWKHYIIIPLPLYLESPLGSSNTVDNSELQGSLFITVDALWDAGMRPQMEKVEVPRELSTFFASK